jgi:hypothetical protein
MLWHFSSISNTNVANEQTFQVGATLAPLATGPDTHVRFFIFEQYNTSA